MHTSGRETSEHVIDTYYGQASQNVPFLRVFVVMLCKTDMLSALR